METKETILILADISGYTKYILVNETSIEHAATNIKILLESIIQELEIPMVVNKFEGDAVLIYLEKEKLVEMWGEEYRYKLWNKLNDFFQLFKKKLKILTSNNQCNCSACKNLHWLELKVLIHAGEVVFHTIHNFNEISWIPVISIHRLLKNSISINEYVLVTELAHEYVELPYSLCSIEKETYDVWEINYSIYSPQPICPPNLVKRSWWKSLLWLIF